MRWAFLSRLFVCLTIFFYSICHCCVVLVVLGQIKHCLSMPHNHQVLVKAVQNVSIWAELFRVKSTSVDRRTETFLIVLHKIRMCDVNLIIKLNTISDFPTPRLAKRLDEQCFYDEVCQFNDENAVCKQIDHNAVCQCRFGYHQVSHSKPTRRVFCVQGAWMKFTSVT